MSNIYNRYRIIKKISYYKRNNLNKILIKIIPAQLIGVFFPVISMIKSYNKKILDIGSGTGLYSYILREKFNSQVDEVEPYLDNDYDNNNIYRITIEEAEIEKKYDVILILDILEHLNSNQIRKLIQIINNNLYDTGVVYIKVPNISSISGLESCFGDITHISQYNDIKLKSFLELNNLKLEKVWGVGPNLRISRLIASLLTFPFKIFLFLYLYSHGCSGNFMSPSIILKVKK